MRIGRLELRWHPKRRYHTTSDGLKVPILHISKIPPPVDQHEPYNSGYNSKSGY